MSLADTRPRRRVFPSARIIDPLNAGDKEISSHRDAYALARQLEEEDPSEQEAAASESLVTPVVSTQSDSTPVPGQPGPTAGAPKRTLTQTSIDSAVSVDPKRELCLANRIRTITLTVVVCRHLTGTRISVSVEDLGAETSTSEPPSRHQSEAIQEVHVIGDDDVDVQAIDPEQTNHERIPREQKTRDIDHFFAAPVKQANGTKLRKCYKCS